MEIILPGDPKKKRKPDLMKVFVNVFFVYIPLAALAIFGIALIVDIVLCCVREGKFLRGIFQALGDVFGTRSILAMKIRGESLSIVQSLRENPMEYPTRLLGCVFPLICANFFEAMACPFCGHYFSSRRISDLSYAGESTREVTHKYDEFQDGVAMDMRGKVYMTLGHTERTQYGTETTTYYKYNSRCGCCGCVYKKQTNRKNVSWN